MNAKLTNRWGLEEERMMRRWHRKGMSAVLLATGILTSTASVASEGVELHIRACRDDPGELCVSSTDGGGNQKYRDARLSLQSKFEFRKGSRVRVSILESNPLLYSYALKKGSATKTSNQLALEKFVDPLSTLAGGISGAAAATGAAPGASAARIMEFRTKGIPPSVETQDCLALLETLDSVGTDLSSYSASRADVVKGSYEDPTGATARRLVAGWELLLQEEILSKAKKRAEELAKNASDGGANALMAAHHREAAKHEEEAAIAQAAAEEASATIQSEERKLEAAKAPERSAIEDEIERLRQLQRDASGNAARSRALAAESRAKLAPLLFELTCASEVNRRVQELESSLARLKEFDALVSTVGDPVVLDPFSLSPSENQPIEVEISRKGNWPKDLKSTRFEGKSSLTLSPESRANISVAGALIYSFVRDPSFEAKAAGDAFEITKTGEPYKKLDLAAMMQIEPKAWDLDPLNLGIQLGVAPQSDWGLFLGVSLRAADMFTFGAGVAFQEVEQLEAGLSEGQVIESADLLKTKKEFETGLYLHITVTAKSPKKD